jgi:hypothetical protein
LVSLVLKRPRRQAFDALRNLRDVIRRRAAAAADDVDEPAGGEFTKVPAGVARPLVVLAEGVGQAGVRIAADMAAGDSRQLGEVGTHVARAQRAVDAHAERPGVGDRHPERIDGLPRERPAAAIGDRRRDHQRQADTLLLEHLFDGDDAGFRVQRVDDGFEEQQIAAAVDQPARLILVGLAQLVEGHRPERRIVDIGGDRQDPVGRPHRSGGEARAIRRARGPFLARRLRQPGTLEVQLVDQPLEAVVGLRDRRAAEGVGLDDVAAGLEILAMDRGDDVGTREHQQIVVASQLAGMRRQPLAAEVGLGQLVTLDHRAHGAVEDENPRREQRVELCACVRLHRHAFKRVNDDVLPRRSQSPRRTLEHSLLRDLGGLSG